jgi:hypothetical protein
VVCTTSHPPQPMVQGGRGAYLVTGGTGALGTVVSRWLLSNGASSLALLGRTGQCNDSCSKAVLLPAFAGSVTMAKCDAGVTSDTQGLTATVLGEEISGVFHAGGILADATLPNQTALGLRRVFAPKHTALQGLVRLLDRHAFAFACLFSSTATLLGSPGQLNYSMANAMLDSCAALAQQSGQELQSIQFGAWKTAGMAVSTASKAERLGFGSLTPRIGLSALQGLLQAQAQRSLSWQLPATIAMTPFDWSLVSNKLRRPLAFFSQYTDVPTSEQEASHSPPAEASTSTRRTEVTVELLRSQIDASIASIVGTAVGGDEPLMAAGLDSLGAVELRNALETSTGLELPGTLVFDYPTATSLTEFLASRMLPPRLPLNAPSASGERVTQREFGQEIMVAISELVIRSSGDALLHMLPADEPRRVPLTRWDVEAQASLSGGALPVQFGVFLRGIADFDAGSFSLSPGETDLMDPQQRLVLETCAEALLARQINDDNISQCGVFVVR